MTIHRRIWCSRLLIRVWLPALAMGLALMVFLSEPYLVNHFVRGHFNWVSMHSLAIAKHSYMALGGVGYSCEFVDAEGGVRFDYFNRYPVPFALLSRWVLSPWVTDPAAWLYAARQWMNLIFLATLAGLFALMRSVGASRAMAITAVLGAAGAEVVLQYKSMFHFDQPSLLFYVILIFSSVKVFVDKACPAYVYYFASVVGIVSGRSAILLIYLAAVLGIVFLRSRSGRSFFPGDATEAFPGVIALRGMLLSVFVLGALTVFNVWVEARANGVGWVEVSIVRSAMRRLGLTFEGFEPRHAEVLRWGGRAIPKLASNAEVFVSPVIIVIFWLLVGILVYLLVARRGRFFGDLLKGVELNEGFYFALAATSISSVAWIVFLKNLFVFHVYAGMVFIPSLCLVLLLLMELLSAGVGMAFGFSRGRLVPIVMLSVVSFFLYQLVERRPEWLNVGLREKHLTESFFSRLKQFNQTVSPRSVVSYSPEWMPRSPYAQCALLNQPLLQGDPAGRVADRVLTTPPSIYDSLD